MEQHNKSIYLNGQNNIEKHQNLTGQSFGLGSNFGANYRLDKVIGKGASGIVYQGVNLTNNELVAIKILREQYANDKEIITRFITERQTLLQLRNPHVVRVYDLIVDQGHLGIVMEYLPGENLRQVLEMRRTLSPSEAVKIVIQVLQALNEAHKKNIIHRDIKPDNIIISTSSNNNISKTSNSNSNAPNSSISNSCALSFNNSNSNYSDSNCSDFKYLDSSYSNSINIDSNSLISDSPTLANPSLGSFTVKVTDFGIAKIFGNQNTATQLVGTPYYMAPELIERGIIAPSVDIYAIGITLYELLCGKTPFHVPNANAFAIAKHHLESKPPKIIGIDERLWQIIEATLSKKATERPSATQLLEQLLALEDSLADLPALPVQSDSTIIPTATVLRPAKEVEYDISEIENKETAEQSQINQIENSKFNPFKRIKKTEQSNQANQLDYPNLNHSNQSNQSNKLNQLNKPNQSKTGEIYSAESSPEHPEHNFPDIDLLPLAGSDTGLKTILHSNANKDKEEDKDSNNNRPISVNEVLDKIVEAQKTAESAAKDKAKKIWIVATSGTLATIIIALVAVLVFINQNQDEIENTLELTAASASIEDSVLPSGLIIGRELELDPVENSLTYSITFETNNQTISGQVMDSLLTPDGVCPSIDWELEATNRASNETVSVETHSAAQTSINAKCAWTFTIPPITLGNPVTVSGVIQISDGIPTDEEGLEEWLNYISSQTDEILGDSTIASTAYPLQRLQGIRLEIPNRVVQGEVISINVLGVWPNGLDVVNPLYKSPSGGAAITSVLDSISGGLGTESVSITENCLGAVLVDNDALSVAALYPSTCEISMTVGSYQSDRVSVTISSNGS